jgi:hypothetical protein
MNTPMDPDAITIGKYESRDVISGSYLPSCAAAERPLNRLTPKRTDVKMLTGNSRSHDRT